MVTIDSGRGSLLTWICKCRFCGAVFALSAKEANHLRCCDNTGLCPICATNEALELDDIYLETESNCRMCEHYNPGFPMIEDPQCGIDRTRVLRCIGQKTPFCSMYISKAAKEFYKNKENKS